MTPSAGGTELGKSQRLDWKPIKIASQQTRGCNSCSRWGRQRSPKKKKLEKRKSNPEADSQDPGRTKKKEFA